MQPRVGYLSFYLTDLAVLIFMNFPISATFMVLYKSHKQTKKNTDRYDITQKRNTGCRVIVTVQVANVAVGDTVSIVNDAEAVRAMQNRHGGWNPKMKNVRSKHFCRNSYNTL